MLLRDFVVGFVEACAAQIEIIRAFQFIVAEEFAAVLPVEDLDGIGIQWIAFAVGFLREFREVVGIIMVEAMGENKPRIRLQDACQRTGLRQDVFVVVFRERDAARFRAGREDEAEHAALFVVETDVFDGTCIDAVEGVMDAVFIFRNNFRNGAFRDFQLATVFLQRDIIIACDETQHLMHLVWIRMEDAVQFDLHFLPFFRHKFDGFDFDDVINLSKIETDAVDVAFEAFDFVDINFVCTEIAGLDALRDDLLWIEAFLVADGHIDVHVGGFLRAQGDFDGGIGFRRLFDAELRDPRVMGAGAFHPHDAIDEFRLRQIVDGPFAFFKIGDIDFRVHIRFWNILQHTA